ncbi:MAG TPA: YncE family protein [Gemmatimonadaceae bacterium]|nr:YncE family protein [Gemmatimonadaceae bacterium]
MRLATPLESAVLVVAMMAAACADRDVTAVRAVSTERPRFTVDPSSRVLAFVSKLSTTDVLNTADNTLETTIATQNPGAIAIAPNGRYAYRSENGLGEIAVIRTSDTRVVDSIAMALQVVQIVFAPDGASAYAAGSGDDPAASGVVFIRTSDNTVQATVPVSSPAGIAVSPDGSRVYVTDPREGQVAVVNTSSRTIERFLPDIYTPEGIIVAPDGLHVYVANFSGNSVLVMNTNDYSGSLVPVGLQPTRLAIAPDGTRLYVTNSGDGTVSVINTSTNAVIATVAVDTDPSSIAVTPDGSRVYVGNILDGSVTHAGSVSVIATSTNTVFATLASFPFPVDIAIATVPQPTPTEATTDLEDAVSDLSGLGAGLSNSLLTKLNAALSAIAAGDVATACQALQDFINEVNAQAGKKISSADAAILIDDANAIRAQLGC